MSDLVGEIRAMFEKDRDEISPESPMKMVSDSELKMTPGLRGMREYFQERINRATRRGYRLHAGAPLNPDHKQAMYDTSEPMLAHTVAIGLGAFSAGVMMGQQNDHLVRLKIFQGDPDALFEMKEFREAAKNMALGFSNDDEVVEFFTDYAKGAMEQMGVMTGFLRRSGNPNKVWDLWIFTSTGLVTASYMAGCRLGTTWREKDVLDGILMATEEGSRGPEGTHG